MKNLTKKKCVPCEGGIPPLEGEEIEKLLSQITGWGLEEVDGHKQIAKEFEFKNFVKALEFVNKVGEIAETEGHHPNIGINYSKVKLSNYTHAIGGLHENDFILAAKIDENIKETNLSL